MRSRSILPILTCSSLLALSSAMAADMPGDDDIPTVEVVAERLDEINVREVKSADLAEALTKKATNISLVRRSGIANDIILRGQKKDNINVLIDDAKVYGACPNRMDPPTSHILTNNVEEVEIIEGPYDVENFGTLSGAVKITTRKPAEEFQGSVSLNVGSWDYRKLAASLSGGTDSVRALISLSDETGAQYEDGDGRDFSEQILADDPASMAVYKPEYRDLDAYEKQTFMGKIYVDVADNQKLEASYTANRSDDILYPSSKMDALYDDSDIFTLDYRISDLGDLSDELTVKVYNSQVDHPMSTYYRMSSGTNSANERINALTTDTSGVKLINSIRPSDDMKLRFGIDFSRRNWDGAYEGFGTSAGITGIKSIPDVDTDNQALFVEVTRDLGDMNLKFGARYDDTQITPASSSGQPENDYSALSAFVFATQKISDTHKLFGGIGKSTRVPDARELYFVSAMGGGMLIGNPDLKDTSNTELDFGVEHSSDGFNMKIKLFYSLLGDYIHYNASKMMRRFDNVDATLYGFAINGDSALADDLRLDFGVAWQRGEKDDPLPGQTDTDLTEVPPMKGNIGLTWSYQPGSEAMAEIVTADSWTDYDADNGEQELDSWAVMNIKVKHRFNDNITLTGGIDNLFDKTYAVSNTYKDLTLLADGTGEVMLLNEPGRYIYLNATYNF